MIVVGTVIVLVTVTDPPSGWLLSRVSAPANKPMKMDETMRKKREGELAKVRGNPDNGYHRSADAGAKPAVVSKSLGLHP